MEAAVQGADILVVAPTGMGKVRLCTFSDAEADITLEHVLPGSSRGRTGNVYHNG